MSFPRLRIAFVSYRFGRQYGGAEAYGVELMKELSKRHDIDVITHEADTELEHSFKVIASSIPSKWPSWVRAYLFAKKTAAITQSTHYDIVHSHVNGWNGDIDVLHVKSVRYHQLTRHRSIFKRLLHLISPRILMYLWLEKQRVHTQPPKRTVVVSELLKHQLQQAYQTNYPFDVITPGVHLPVRDPAIRLKQRQQLGYSPHDIICIQVARNPLAKGLATLLKALTLLPDHIKLLVVGAPATLAPLMIKKLEQQQLQSRVRFIEQQAEISSYYQSADICVHPTLNDSFGMAPLEAMSYQLPVIMSAANWCGFAHYVTHKKQALLLTQPENHKEIAQAIQTLINKPNLKQRLIEQANELVEQFSWPELAKRYESIYFEVIAGRLHRHMPDPLAQ